MGWNYRVMRHAPKDGELDEWYAIHEVYYRSDEVDDLRARHAITLADLRDLLLYS
jgi:hypothetical protein